MILNRKISSIWNIVNKTRLISLFPALNFLKYIQKTNLFIILKLILVTTE